MAEESKLVDKLEAEQSAVKFTEDEMNTLKGIRDSYMETQQRFGQLSMTKLRLEKQFDSIEKTESDLVNKFNEIQQSEKDFLGKIQEKYGDGELDPETGTFHPVTTENN